MNLRICAVLLLLTLSVGLQWASRLILPDAPSRHGEGHTLVAFDDSGSSGDIFDGSSDESVAVDGGVFYLPARLASVPRPRVLLTLCPQTSLLLSIRLIRTSYTSSAI